MGNSASPAGAIGQFTGLLAGRSQRTSLSIWDLSVTTGLPGAADATADSAEAAEGLQTAQRHQRTMQEYTAARGLLDNSTFRERG
jgi:hypothetical protein